MGRPDAAWGCTWNLPAPGVAMRHPGSEVVSFELEGTDREGVPLAGRPALQHVGQVGQAACLDWQPLPQLPLQHGMQRLQGQCPSLASAPSGFRETALLDGAFQYSSSTLPAT